MSESVRTFASLFDRCTEFERGVRKSKLPIGDVWEYRNLTSRFDMHKFAKNLP